MLIPYLRTLNFKRNFLRRRSLNNVLDDIPETLTAPAVLTLQKTSRDIVEADYNS